MTIHATDPFATPDDARSPLRRLRARMPATVTLWSSYGRDSRPAGLTVSSTVVAEGDPGLILGLVDDESELYAALTHSGRCAVTVLADGDGQLADRFAGLMPAPGGLFGDLANRTDGQGRGGLWEATEYGPVRSGRHPWVGCTLTSASPIGYGVLVTATVDRVELGPDGVAPLVRYRGRYVRPGSNG